jgi:hypothetical protein
MLGLLPLHGGQIVNKSKNREVQDRRKRVVCGETSGVHQALTLGAEVSTRHVNPCLGTGTDPYALSPLRVSDFKEAVSLSSNVAPFFCAKRKGWKITESFELPRC